MNIRYRVDLSQSERDQLTALLSGEKGVRSSIIAPNRAEEAGSGPIL